mmetsp:Transcript_36693/g.67275  ORF Transcript_36693/g.67275 Transcript_36693/m.67275 type:complete len:528 (-) Transcript_36693:175-1758(-)
MAPVEDVSTPESQTLAGKCPAFEQGCPYKDAVGAIPEDGWHGKLEEMPLLSLKGCPAFTNTCSEEGGIATPTCPFSKATDLGAVGEAMSQMPTSHSEQGTKAHEALVQSLKVMHSASMAARERLEGRACPVFDNGCPFKQCVTTTGKPLVLEIEARSWLAGQEKVEEATPASQEPAALEINLSKMLKVGTQAAHKEAESGSFVKRLLRGKSSPEEYRRLLVDLHHVYEALEISLERAASTLDHAIVKSIHFPRELNRTESLARDLEYWFRDVPGGAQATQPSPAAATYAARVKEIAETHSTCHLLVSHAYTRYLGDLSGGQLLKRSICRAMPVGSDGEGVEFYDFENVDNQKDFKNRYRDQLDELEVAPELADEMVEEANKAFDYNGAIFAHLDELAGIPASKASEPAPVLPAGHPTLKVDADLAQCPFAALAQQVRAEQRAEAKSAGNGARQVEHRRGFVAALGRFMPSLTQCPFAGMTGQAPAAPSQPKAHGEKKKKITTAIIGTVVLFGPVLAAAAVFAVGNSS